MTNGFTQRRFSFIPIAPYLLFFVLITFLHFSCQPRQTSMRTDRITIGIAADLDYLNPLTIQLGLSREVCTMLYPTLFTRVYDEEAGVLSFEPGMARAWEFFNHGRSARFILKSNVLWSDSTRVTANDFAFSYRLYGHPAVASTRQDYIHDLLRNQDGSIDFDRAIEVVNDTTLVLHFQSALPEGIIFDHFYDLMPVPKHVYDSIAPQDLRMVVNSLPVISAGPFKVSLWQRQQKLVLESNPLSSLPHPAKTTYIEFQIIPEYTTRLTALKTGAIDAMIANGGISPPDADRLKQESPHIHVFPVKNRFFDSIVWLTIDGTAYRTEKRVKPNVFFGDTETRQALTYAINREAIIDGFMQSTHASIVNSSLSPAYSSLLHPSLHPYAYSPSKARELLERSGWKKGPSGILEKKGVPFRFSLVIPTGNSRRAYASTIIQQNLKDIGIDCRLEYVETLLWNKGQNSWEYDATIAGLGAETLPFQLVMWGSDFEKNNFNSSAFQDSELDSVLMALSKPQPPDDEKKLWYRFQEILHQQQPRTFLYYYDELEGVNTRISGVKMNMLMTLLTLHEWEIKPKSP